MEETTVMYSKDCETNAEEKVVENEQNGLKKLVAYYINDLKFRPVTGFSDYTILKPRFERTCYTLIQEVVELPHKRELIWASHDSDQEMERTFESCVGRFNFPRCCKGAVTFIALAGGLAN